jgi:hypothetical protein
MDVLLLLVMIAILVGVFCVAIGKGGELAYAQADHAPLDLGPVSATDVALLRPPTALWGYNMQVTDEALGAIARALRERDIEIAFLQRQLADLGQEVPTAADIERARAFSPRHASGLSSDDDNADPWSRLWGGSGAKEEPEEGAPPAETTEFPAAADTAITDTDTAITDTAITDTADPDTADTAADSDVEEQGW